MAIDASIALNANRPVPTQYNPLQMQAQVAQTGSAVIGAQRAQAEYAAQQAQGRASQGAIGPDGVYDPAAANSAMSADPAAAYGIQGALSNNQKLAQDQQTRSTQAQSNISQMYTSLLSLPDSQLTAQAITGGLSRYRASGAINAQDERAVLSDIPQQGGAGAIRQMLARRAVSNLSPSDAVSAVTGAPGMMDNGQQRQPGLIAGAFNPNAQQGSFNPAGGSTQTYPSRGDLATRVPGAPDANGAPTTEPLSNQTPPWLAGPAGTMGNGRYPQQAPTNPNGKVATGQSPYSAAQNTADVTAYQQAKAAAPQQVQDTQTLGHALDALKILQNDSLSSGPGSEAAHKLYAYAVTLGFATPGMQDNAAAYELAKKNLTRYAASSGTTAHTDLGLGQSIAANASVDAVGNQAAQTVVKQEIGKRNQAIASTNELNDPSKTGIGYSAHASNFAQATDPRAFAFDHYTPSEQSQILSTLKPGSPERKRFTDSLVIAKRNGFITPPGG